MNRSQPQIVLALRLTVVAIAVTVAALLGVEVPGEAPSGFIWDEFV